MRTVLHILDHGYRLDPFTTLHNLIHVSRGVEPVTLHIDREDGTTDMITYDRDGAGDLIVASRGAGNCGCP